MGLRNDDGEKPMDPLTNGRPALPATGPPVKLEPENGLLLKVVLLDDGDSPMAESSCELLPELPGRIADVTFPKNGTEAITHGARASMTRVRVAYLLCWRPLGPPLINCFVAAARWPAR